MTLLLILTPASFSEVSHIGIIRVFQELEKRPTIPEIESKQYALLNLHIIINSFCVLGDNRLKNYQPLGFSLHSTNPVKFYIQDFHKSLPDFPGRCVVALGRAYKRGFSFVIDTYYLP